MLKMRIQLLQDKEIISKEVSEFMMRVIEKMEKELPNAPFDHVERFTTHMAMAAERVRKGETVEGLDPDDWSQVETCSESLRSKILFEEMMAFSPVCFPESEQQYLIMHICNILAETETNATCGQASIEEGG